MMSDAIYDFPKQFTYKPEVLGGKLRAYKKFVLLGMGGSHLAADLALLARPELPLTVHMDYGLPARAKADCKDTLVIASSYSGNTEEVIDGMKEAKKNKLPLVAIAVGGEVIARAKKNRIPYIELPNTRIQPRSALGFSLLAILKVIGDEASLRLASRLATSLRPKELLSQGNALAARLK